MRGRWDAEQDPIRALRRGDPRPYEDFVRGEALTFLGFFRRLGADPHEAEDLTQDVFLRLYNGAREYVPSERFEAYAFRVARNCWIDRQRRRAARGGGESAPVEMLDDIADARAAETGAALERGEQAGLIQCALGRLPEAHRQVFELGVVQELPYGEIADLLGVPVGTVKSRMFHAVRRVREEIAREEIDRARAGLPRASSGPSGPSKLGEPRAS